MTFEQWFAENRHWLRIEFMRDHEPHEFGTAVYANWLREKYATEHPTADDPSGQ